MIRPLIRSLLLLVVLVAVIVPAAGVGASSGAGSVQRAETSTIYFVPVGDVSSVALDERVRYYKQKFNSTSVHCEACSLINPAWFAKATVCGGRPLRHCRLPIKTIHEITRTNTNNSIRNVD